MRTIDLHDDNGSLIGFQVSNSLLSRKEAERIVRRIPGAKISRPVRRLFSSEPGRDDFCVFQVGETEFEIVEPFGDSSQFWVVGHPLVQPAELEVVRAAFRNWRPLLAPSALIRIAVLALLVTVLIRTLVLQ